MIDDFYLWIKALHIIAVIAWMAGLLYLPRLFVYHCQVEAGSAQSELFKVMERRLLKAIMGPAMMAAWVLGAVLAWNIFDGQYWLYAKLLLVVVLTVAHMVFAGFVKAFAEDRNVRSETFYRIVNEVPTLIMIAVVILVIVRPF